MLIYIDFELIVVIKVYVVLIIIDVSQAHITQISSRISRSLFFFFVRCETSLLLQQSIKWIQEKKRPEKLLKIIII